MSEKIYLDNGATTRPAPEVIKAMTNALEEFGNPSSLHSTGRAAAKLLKESRKTIANRLGCSPEEIIFTSGGTEANNLAIKGIAQLAAKQDKNHIITSAIEHAAVLNTCKELEKKGFKLTVIPVDKEGIINPEDIRAAITEKTCLVSIMHANNEIGTIQPIEEIATICKEKSIKFHTDAVQSFTKQPIDLKNINLLSISSHNFHGPKGVGALYVKAGTQLAHQIVGGAQERKLRAGTENIPGIVGFAKAVTLITDEDIKQMQSLRDNLIDSLLKIPHTTLNGSREKRLCNNVNISFHFVEGEALLMHCDLKGLQVSTASACSSLELKASHVLLALGMKEEFAHTTLRFTLSKYTTKEEIKKTISIVKDVVEKLRKISPLKEGVEFKGDDFCHH